ncbi:hypothetical protein KFK09_011234 [Dendrobium nobile]|uniref:Uncharacterized protein n=1 Tax=Dendrobium nobile TaxID=94219 RepID=A0A8T3BCA4_DENNO|nr:hypothetical protein KFK09_011234 [Dendrobium nobile]
MLLLLLYWKHLSIMADKIKRCFFLTIHYGSNLSLLWDPWCNGTSIANILDDARDLSFYSSFYCWDVGKIINGNSWIIPLCFEATIVSKIHNVCINNQIENHLWLDITNQKFKNFRSQFYSSCTLSRGISWSGTRIPPSVFLLTPGWPSKMD